MTLQVNVAGVWKQQSKSYVNVGGVWKEIKQEWVNVGGVWKQLYVSTIPLVISANTANYSVFVAAGSPTSAVDVQLTINAGVYVYSTSTANAAIELGALPAGSTVTIINNGYIMGMGGAGGFNTNGGVGGPAINLSAAVSIDNSAGYIAGGGGGGGGGTASTSGGGGGAGGGNGGDSGAPATGGAGGGPGALGGLSTMGGTGAGSGGVGGVFGTTGGGGGRVIPGSGGTSPTNPPGTPGGSGGAAGSNGGTVGNCGGGGGGWGAAGGWGNGGATTSGAGGKAVALNGFAVTWLAGNNSTQVLGAVS